jgi:hypothetical protein
VDLYHIWFDLKPGVQDLAFCEHLRGYLDKLKNDQAIHDWRLTRRKLGLGAEGLGEFHVVVEVKGLAQLDQAFEGVASRREPIEGLHHAVNSRVQNARFALYRDFPDAVRHHGEEKF